MLDNKNLNYKIFIIINSKQQIKAMLIKINQTEYDSLQKMAAEEYKNFLENKLLDIQQDEKLKSFRIGRDNDLYRVLSATPYLYEGNKKIRKYEETSEQRKARLQLKKQYNDEYITTVKEPKAAKVVETTDGEVLSTTVESIMNISRNTLYTLYGDPENSNFEIINRQRRLYVNKKSLLAYLDKYHYCSTNLKMEQMYSKVKSLTYGKKGEEILKEQLDEILESDECKQKWQEYYNTVPEDKRVYRMAKQIKLGKVTIHQIDKSDNNFIKYNPNIKICDKPLTEIPQLYTVNYWAAILGVGDRTILRYCELGYLTHFKIGGKTMISTEDFKETSSNLDKITTDKHSTGRRKRIEHVFNDDIVKNDKIISKFSGTVDFDRYRKAVLEIEELENKRTALRNSLIDEKSEAKQNVIKAEIKTITASIGRINKAATKHRRAFTEEVFSGETMKQTKALVNEYIEKQKDLKVYIKNLNEAKENHKDILVQQMEFLITDLKNQLNNLQNQILEIVL